MLKRCLVSKQAVSNVFVVWVCTMVWIVGILELLLSQLSRSSQMIFTCFPHSSSFSINSTEWFVVFQVMTGTSPWVQFKLSLWEVKFNPCSKVLIVTPCMLSPSYDSLFLAEYVCPVFLSQEVDKEGLGGEKREHKLYIGNLDHRVTE